MAASTITIGQAVPAARVSRSIGVCTHWEYPNVYTTQYTALKARLLELGIKHVRGDVSRVADLWAAGIRSTVSGYTGGATPAEVIASLRSLAAVGAIYAIEGPNEPDNFWLARTYRGQTGPAASLLWQQDLWAEARADSAFATTAIIGPALGKTYFGGGSPFPADILEDYCDYGNFHPYPQANTFTQAQITYANLSSYYYRSTMPSNTLDVYPRHLTAHRPPFGTKPMMATESGYPTWSQGQSIPVQAKYVPRIMLENFRLGVERTWLYELVNQGTTDNREQSFGLLYNDLTPKPAWNQLKAVIAAFSDPLADPTVPSTPVSMSLTVNPPAGSGFTPAQVHHVAAVKADGTRVIAIWHEVTGEDLQAAVGARDLTHPGIPATLDMGRAMQGVSVVTMDPLTGSPVTPAALSVSGQAVSFDITDTVTIITASPVPANTGGPGNPTGRWDFVPVYGTWHRDPATEEPCTGYVTLSITHRITRTDGSAIYPKGVTRRISLDGTGSIATAFPAVDDPDIVEQDWVVKVVEEIDGSAPVTYEIEPRLSHLLLDPPGVNLVRVQQQTGGPSPAPALIRGVPGGLAGLDADGDVIDADGGKVTALDLSLLATPRTVWAPATAYPAWANVTYQQGFYTATKAIPARTTFGDAADGWWLTGYDAGTM